jgi:hypothetical protein
LEGHKQRNLGERRGGCNTSTLLTGPRAVRCRHFPSIANMRVFRGKWQGLSSQEYLRSERITKVRAELRIIHGYLVLLQLRSLVRAVKDTATTQPKQTPSNSTFLLPYKALMIMYFSISLLGLFHYGNSVNSIVSCY